MIDIIKKLLFTILSKSERNRSFFLVILLLISALLDVLGIASIVPLIALLSNPDLIENNILINNVYLFFNFNDPQIFLFYVGLFFFAFFVISMIVKTIVIYFQVRFNQMCEYSVGKRLLQNYLYQPYIWFLDHHSSDLAKNIISTVNLVINRGLLSILEIISQSMVIFFIITLLFIVDPKLMLTVSLTLGIIYGITYKSFSSILNHKGTERVKKDQERFTSLSNSFGSIKETKLGGLENFYVKSFSVAAKKFAQNQSSAQIISQLPRHLFEALAFGGLLLIILYLMRKSINFTSILPILSLYVFAGYRLMPALQQLYNSFTSLRFANAAIDSVYKDLSLKPDVNKANEKLDFKEVISLENITFNYPKSSKTNLSKISLKISAKSTVGFIGATGSGKTTLADIILGLLEPQEGTLKVDNTIINKNWE